MAGNSGCYTVTINQQSSGQPPFFTGTATGDVVANTSTLLDVATFTGHGVAYGQEALDWWTVTGGIIEELIGESFSISHRSLAIWSPDTDPWVARLNGTGRAGDGVSKANLTYHGTLAAGPTFVSDIVWQGVICP
jgi:hypothetical protein